MTAVFTSRFNPGSAEATQCRAALQARLDALRALEDRAAAASSRSLPQFEKRGQLLPRQRVALLLDAGAPWLPLCTLAGYLQDVKDPEKSVPGGGMVAGIGFVLTKQTGIVGIDLDHCVENGVVNTWAAGIIESVGGFAELSPSGTGVHIYIKGSLPWPNKRTNEIELYSHNSYLTVTGHWLRTEGALSGIAA